MTELGRLREKCLQLKRKAPICSARGQSTSDGQSTTAIERVAVVGKRKKKKRRPLVKSTGIPQPETRKSFKGGVDSNSRQLRSLKRERNSYSLRTKKQLPKKRGPFLLSATTVEGTRRVLGPERRDLPKRNDDPRRVTESHKFPGRKKARKEYPLIGRRVISI